MSAAGDLQATMTRQAETFADVAARHNFTLDFTPDSLRTLEEMLGVLFRPRNPFARRGGKLDAETYAPTIPIVGAYVGEVIRRHLGGRWARHDGTPALRFGDGDWIFPLDKADKRFRNGRTDALDFFYDVMSGLRAHDSPASR